MSVAVGVDIGAYKHAVAVCRQGVREAERKALKISANRQGFEELEAWMARQPESVGMVVMESSGHYWFNLASHLRRRGYEVAVVNPLEAKYFAKSRLQRSKSDPARRAHTCSAGNARPTEDLRPLGGSRTQAGVAVRHAPGARAGPGLPADPALGGHWLPRAARGLGRPYLHERAGRIAQGPNREGGGAAAA